MKIKHLAIILGVAAVYAVALGQNNIAEEVAWVVGDEPIFKSDIEEEYQLMVNERIPISGNPYCAIPERMAIDKLFLNQARIDTVDIPNSQVQQAVDSRINYFIANLGSKEKLEEYFGMTMGDLRERQMNTVRDQMAIQEVQRNLTKNIKATPADVRKFYNGLSKDSLPYIPMQVEVQMVSINPVVPQQKIDEVKAQLRDFSNKVNSGEMDFATLAILHSEDGSSSSGGEVGFKGRAELLPEYAAVAFNLSDNKRVSKIVETEAGFHIIQLIERRGDRVNTRHILLRPKVSESDITMAHQRLDSLRNEIMDKKVTFEQAALYVSQDKDSKNNNGLMMNSKTHTTLFEMADLPQEIGKVVATMQPGDISQPFIMLNTSTGRQQVVMVKLSRRVDGHRADLAEDYQVMKDLYEDHRREEIISKWIIDKIKETHVFIEEGWRNCDFKYDWLKTKS